MLEMNLLDFTHDEEFPFFIQYWVHIGNMLMHSHKDFSELSQLYLKTSDSSDPMINLAKAIAHIESYYTQNIEVAELAAISNYSVRQFIRIFKKIYDCKPTEYIRRLRMKSACILLKSGSLPITDIAIRCGYGDGNYFSRVFTKDMGITPREYRKRNQALD